LDNTENGESNGDEDEVGSNEVSILCVSNSESEVMKSLTKMSFATSLVQEEEEKEAELEKNLGKVRRRAMAAARGRRKSQSSRNTYKDKGRGSQNSKIHSNMSGF